MMRYATFATSTAKSNCAKKYPKTPSSTTVKRWNVGLLLAPRRSTDLKKRKGEPLLQSARPRNR
jgi:hypothetical protein